MNISIIGTGYVGLTTGLALASKGHVINFIDIDSNKVNKINNQESPFFESGIENFMNKYKDYYSATTSYDTADHGDIIFIAVPTPEKKDGSAELKYVNNVIMSLGEITNKKKLLVIKSTVPVGTNKNIQENIQESGLNFEIASNPEFLSQGTALNDSLNPNRIILGTQSSWAKDILMEVYKDFEAPKEIMGLNSAELVKYTANTFQALKIAFINEIASISEVSGANIDDVVRGIKHDPVIGSKFLNSGIGFGGSCFPKDIQSLSNQASKRGLELNIIPGIYHSNKRQILKLAKMTTSKNIGILGLSFKPNTDDTRETPSHYIIEYLNDKGIIPFAYDPKASEVFKNMYPSDKVIIVSSTSELIDKVDEVILATEWDEFKKMDEEDFKGKKILDGRRIYDFADFQIGKGN